VTWKYLLIKYLAWEKGSVFLQFLSTIALWTSYMCDARNASLVSTIHKSSIPAVAFLSGAWYSRQVAAALQHVKV
jgi:hypothetical protein